MRDPEEPKPQRQRGAMVGARDRKGDYTRQVFFNGCAVSIWRWDSRGWLQNFKVLSATELSPQKWLKW